MSLLLAQQIVVLFLIMGLGFLLVRSGHIQPSDSRVLSILSIYLIMPCVILNAFQIDYTPDIRNGFFLAVGAAVLIHLLLLALCSVLRRLFKLRTEEYASLIYSNAGNLIIPLVTSVLGGEWVIYASAFMCVQQFFFWTHCDSLMQHRRGTGWRKLLSNLNVICILIGAVLFFTGIRLPGLVLNAVTSVASLLGPLSMIMIGMLLAAVDWPTVLKTPRTYGIVLLKMLALPLCVLAFLKLSGLARLVPDGSTILLISFLAVTTPSASTVTQLAQLHNCGPANASAINALTTLASIATMPLMILLYLSC